MLMLTLMLQIAKVLRKTLLNFPLKDLVCDVAKIIADALLAFKGRQAEVNGRNRLTIALEMLQAMQSAAINHEDNIMSE